MVPHVPAIGSGGVPPTILMSAWSCISCFNEFIGPMLQAIFHKNNLLVSLYLIYPIPRIFH